MDSSEDARRRLEVLGHSFGVESASGDRCVKCGSSKGFAVVKSLACKFKSVSLEELKHRFTEELGHRTTPASPEQCVECSSPLGNAVSWGVVCRYKGLSDAEISEQKEQAERIERKQASERLTAEIKEGLARAPGALAEIVVESLAASAKVIGSVRRLFPRFKP